MSNATEENIKHFGSTKSIEAYSSDYLRSSERYVIDNFAKPGARVLDLGCGTGRTTLYIYRNVADSQPRGEGIGVDPAESMIERGKELHPELDLRVGDARKLEFPDNHFDLVFFSFNGLDNLFPISERERAIAEIKRVLKSGGVFAYSSHNSLALPHTAHGLLDLVRNIPKLRIGPHYRNINQGFGKLVQYYNNVWNEERRIKSSGLTLLTRL